MYICLKRTERESQSSDCKNTRAVQQRIRDVTDISRFVGLENRPGRPPLENRDFRLWSTSDFYPFSSCPPLPRVCSLSLSSSVCILFSAFYFYFLFFFAAAAAAPCSDARFDERGKAISRVSLSVCAFFVIFISLSLLADAVSAFAVAFRASPSPFPRVHVAVCVCESCSNRRN